jgi:hypothetical protein
VIGRPVRHAGQETQSGDNQGNRPGDRRQPREMRTYHQDCAEDQPARQAGGDPKHVRCGDRDR